MKRYLVTGYSKKDGRMNTHTYVNIEDVVELINLCEWPDPTTTHAENMPVKSAHDLDFDAQSKANHGHAHIIITPKYAWSIFFVK